MAKKEIHVEVDMESGDIVIMPQGFAGKECFQATEDLERGLGRVIEKTPTGEAYKPKRKEVMRRGSH